MSLDLLYRCAVVSVVLFVASPAAADVLPAYDVRLLGRPAPARRGEPVDLRLAVRVSRSLVFGGIQAAGPGWEVTGVSLLEPEPDAVEALPPGEGLDTFEARVQAVPGEATGPLGLILDLDGVDVAMPLDLSPAGLDRILKPQRLIWNGPSGPPPPETVASDGFPAWAPAEEQTHAGRAPGPERGAGGGGRRVRATGRILYRDRDQNLRPADGCAVEIIDADPILPDNEVASGYTDESGFFSISFTWDPCPIVCDQDPDLYVLVISRNGAVTVEGTVITTDYKAESEEKENFTGEDAEFGSLFVTGDTAYAFHVVSQITRAWRWLSREHRVAPSHVDVKYPFHAPGSTPFYAWETNSIQIPSEYANRWHEDALIHEYGHHWMHDRGLFDRDLGIIGTEGSYCVGPCAGCGHCRWCRESALVAWQEGICHWIADAATRAFEAEYPGEPIHRSDLEILQGDAECPEMDEPPLETEGYVAATLLDIEDAENELDSGDARTQGVADVLTAGAAAIFQVVVLDRPERPLGFLNRFAERFPQFHRQLQTTAQHNGLVIDGPTLVEGRAFSDDFARPGPLPGPWTPAAGPRWRLVDEELSVNTGSLAAFRAGWGASDVTALHRTSDGTIDLVFTNPEGHLIHFEGTPADGWTAMDVTASMPGGGVGLELLRVAALRSPLGTWPEAVGLSRRVVAGGLRDVIRYAPASRSGWSTTNTLNVSAAAGGQQVSTLDLAVIEDDLQPQYFGVRYGSLIHFYRTVGINPTWRADDIHALAGLPPDLTGPLKVLSLDDGSLNVLALARDPNATPTHYLVHLRRAGGQWSRQAHTALPDSTPLPTIDPFTLAAISREGASIDAFAIATSGAIRLLHYRWHPGKGASVTDLASLSPGVRGPTIAAGSRTADTLDLVALADSSDPFGRRAIHLSWSESAGWGGGPLSSSEALQGDSAGPVLLVSDPGALDAFYGGGGRVHHGAWNDGLGWRVTDLTAAVMSSAEIGGGGLAAVGHGDGALVTFSGGPCEGVRCNVLQHSREPGAGWLLEDLHGGKGGTDPWIIAGSPPIFFRGVGAVEARLLFLARPTAPPGRIGGIFLGGFGPSAVAQGNTGYAVLFADENPLQPPGVPAPAYHVIHHRPGMAPALVARFPAADPGERWRLEIEGMQVTLRVDGLSVGSFNVAQPLDGYLGFWAGGNGQDFRLDDVRVDEGSEVVPLFRRGDANADGSVNVSDAIAALLFLFGGLSSLPCLDAADFDDNGRAEITDAIAALNHLFGGGPAPAVPGLMTCGEDPTADSLAPCDAATSCG